MGGGTAKNRRESDSIISTIEATSTGHTLHLSHHYQLTDFDILRVIGTGSYSNATLAIDKHTHEPVVLKIMSKSLIIKKGQVEHIKNERAILSRVRCRFVEQLKATFQTPISLYYVLEYLPGGELFRLLNERSTLTLDEAAFYAGEVVLALRYLHSLNCVFRDLKPENILIANDGHLKLVDFGFAKYLKGDGRTFTLCGTPEYMSPEVIEKTGHTLNTDWWQLGILIYEMLFASTPFSDPSPYQLYENILSRSVTFPSVTPIPAYNHAISLISGLLEKQPSSRLTEPEILHHPFFSGIDWNLLEKKEIAPPFVPEVNNPTDSHNFDSYIQAQEQGTAVYVDVFPEF